MRVRLLTDHALSSRLERAEGLAASRFVEARARCQPETGAAWQEVAGAYILFDGPQSPVTQTFGLGLSSLPSEEEMQAIEEFFETRGSATLHEVSPLADPAMLALLAGRAYRPLELTSVLVQELDGPRTSEPGILVREVRPEERPVWAQVAAAGWRDTMDLTDAMTGFLQISSTAEGLHTYFAEIDGTPVATAAMALCNGVALLAGAATVPEWRGRGAQLALLRHRLSCAAGFGCDLAMMGAAPGSASQRNAERQGFRIAYTRIKWSR